MLNDSAHFFAQIGCWPAVGVGEAAHDPGAPADLLVQSLDHVVRAQLDPMVRGEPRQEAGGGLADALAQAVRGRLELVFLHFARDRPCLGHGGFAVFMCKRLKIVPKPGHVLFIGTHNRIYARRRALSWLTTC